MQNQSQLTARNHPEVKRLLEEWKSRFPVLKTDWIAMAEATLKVFEKSTEIDELIIEGKDLLSKQYDDINLGHDKIRHNVFDDIAGYDMPDLTEQKIISLIHNYFQKRRDKWPKQEIANTEQTKPEKEMKISLKTAALMHFYLASNGGRAITMQNREDLASKFGHNAKNSGKHLYDYFQTYKKDTERLSINCDSAKSARAHLQRFSDIVLLLEGMNMPAFNHAKRDLETINKKVSNLN